MIDHDHIAALVAGRMKDGPPARTADLADEIATIIEASTEPVDLPQILRRYARYIVREQARRRVSGRRRTELVRAGGGETLYVASEQLTIEELREAGVSKIRSSERERVTGLADITVANEAGIEAARRGLDMLTTCVDDVVSPERQREIRDEIINPTTAEAA